MQRLTLLFLLFPASAAAQSATTDELDDAARAAFVAGENAFEEGDYETALRAFSSGYELSPRPTFLFNIASCHDRLHHSEEARDFYRRYLEAMPDAPNRDYVERRMRAIGAPTPPSSNPATEDDDGPSYVPAWTAFAIGGVGAVTFAVAGALALSTHSSLADCRPTGTCEPGLGDQGRTQALVADIGLGVAVAGTIAGILLFLVADSDEPSSDVRVTPTASNTGGGVLVEGSLW